MLKYISTYPDEKSYRADKTALNYSLLSDFCKKQIRSFRKKYIDGLDDEDDDTNSTRVGLLVHAKLADIQKEFDRNFYLSSLTKKPEPQYLRFCENLFKLTLNNSKDGVFQGDFSEIFEEAYNISEITTPKLPKFTLNFTGNLPEMYYEELRKSHGKQIVTLEDFELMERVIKKARETQPEILNHKDCLNELPIKFEFMGIVFRVLLDRVNLHHDTKVIEPFDWKITGMNGEKEFLVNYFKLNYFIQNHLYQLGVEAWAQEHYPDYKVKPLRYVAMDDKGLYPTIVHEFEFGFDTPWTGFTYNNRYYKGIYQIVEELNWHKENNIWDMTKSTWDNKGIIKHTI